MAYADKWYREKYGPLVSAANFMKSTVLVSTFDESGGGRRDQIYNRIVDPPQLRLGGCAG